MNTSQLFLYNYQITDEILCEWFIAYLASCNVTNLLANCSTIRSFGLWLYNTSRIRRQVDYDLVSHGVNMSRFFNSSRDRDTVFVNSMINRIRRALDSRKSQRNITGQTTSVSAVENQAVEASSQVKSTHQEQGVTNEDTTDEGLCSLLSAWNEYVREVETAAAESMMREVPPVIVGYRDTGNELNESVLRQIDTVTIYDAPSEDAIRSGCAGMGSSGFIDFRLAVELEGFSPYDDKSVIVEAIKLPCSSIYNIDYTDEEINRWIDLLIAQLKLFPKLKFIRVLCSKNVAKKLFKKLNLETPKKGVLLDNVKVGSKEVFLKWYSHPSPRNLIFRPGTLQDERTELAAEVRPRVSPLSPFDYSTFEKQAIDQMNKRNITIPLLKRYSLPRRKENGTISESEPAQDQRDLQSKILSETAKMNLLRPKPTPCYDRKNIDEFNRQLSATPFRIPIDLSNETSHNGVDCQFDSISVQLNDGPSSRELRTLAVDYIRRNIEDFREFFPIEDSWEDYLYKMSTNEHGSDSWGDEMTLRALSQVLCREIVVVQPGRSFSYSVENPSGGEPLYLAYLNRNHYEPLVINNSTLPDTQESTDVSLVELEEVELDTSVILEEESTSSTIISTNDDWDQGSTTTVPRTIRVGKKKKDSTIMEEIAAHSAVRLEAAGGMIQRAISLAEAATMDGYEKREIITGVTHYKGESKATLTIVLRKS